MTVSDVIEFVRPFDPLGVDAEDEYNRVAHRVNRIRHERVEVARELAELERQFVENDFAMAPYRLGRQRRERAVRRVRLDRLLELRARFDRLGEEERIGLTSLAHMNDALDRWARETYGA